MHMRLDQKLVFKFKSGTESWKCYKTSFTIPWFQILSQLRKCYEKGGQTADMCPGEVAFLLKHPILPGKSKGLAIWRTTDVWLSSYIAAVLFSCKLSNLKITKQESPLQVGFSDITYLNKGNCLCMQSQKHLKTVIVLSITVLH